MLISVDFWKSMNGFAMDSRTRVDTAPRLLPGLISLKILEFLSVILAIQNKLSKFLYFKSQKNRKMTSEALVSAR